MQPWRPSHFWAYSEGIFFRVDPAPFVPAWQLDKSPERSAVQEALLAMYLSEGGMASSGRTAQFMKALTLVVWRVSGRLTSLRLVQCTKVNSCISSICVLERSTFLSRWQLSQACAPMTAKPCVSVSVVIPVELRQPRAKSLAVVCDGSSLGEGISRRVNSARLIQPRKR